MNQLGDLTPTEYRAVMLGARYPGDQAKDSGSTFLPPSGFELPDTVDWRTKGYVTPVKNQGKILKPLFHSPQKSTRKLAASAFKYCDWMKVLAASVRVGF